MSYGLEFMEWDLLVRDLLRRDSFSTVYNVGFGSYSLGFRGLRVEVYCLRFVGLEFKDTLQDLGVEICVFDVFS